VLQFNHRRQLGQAKPGIYGWRPSQQRTAGWLSRHHQLIIRAKIGLNNRK
jgi:hypothetical protein